MTDEIIVDVFNNGKLVLSEMFITGRNLLGRAHRFTRSHLAVGNTCVISELQNGRPWCVIKYKPQS